MPTRRGTGPEDRAERNGPGQWADQILQKRTSAQKRAVARQRRPPPTPATDARHRRPPPKPAPATPACDVRHRHGPAQKQWAMLRVGLLGQDCELTWHVTAVFLPDRRETPPCCRRRAAFWWSGRQVMALSSTLRGLVSKLVRDPPYTNHTAGGAHSAVQQRAALLTFSTHKKRHVYRNSASSSNKQSKYRGRMGRSAAVDSSALCTSAIAFASAAR